MWAKEHAFHKLYINLKLTPCIQERIFGMRKCRPCLKKHLDFWVQFLFYFNTFYADDCTNLNRKFLIFVSKLFT